MNQNLLSRIFGAGSVYETINEDAESVAGYNLSQRSTYSPSTHSQYGMSFHPYMPSGKSRANMSDHDDVPESIMYERGVSDDEMKSPEAPARSGKENVGRLPPRPDELTSPVWQAGPEITARKGMNDAKDRALWRWANVNNLDVFLREVYGYFLGNGIYSILLSRTLNLLTLAFVTSFSTYLMTCIDYSKVRHSTTLKQIQVDHCMANLSNTALAVLWLLTMFWLIKGFQYLSDVRSLWEMHNFYYHLLDISETDMQTISWQEIVNRVMALRDSNPITSSPNKHAIQSRERMDAHDIANRIMRKDNYLIAMFNKEVLDLRVPLPFLSRPLLTRSLEWNLGLCIMAYIFDEQGQIRSAFVRDAGPNRKLLVDGLKRRFLFAGLMNAILAPFIIIYLLLVYFFRYFNEYHKNPSSLGSRKYTPYAQVTFREFNELFHIFKKRLNLSHQYANKYVSQFPNDKTMQIARFTSFVAGSFAAVLALASIIDPDLFLGFEITHDRTVLFYLGLFGTIVAVSRSLVPEDKQVFDPEVALLEVIEYTHYSPTQWQGKFHSHETKADFCKLYDYKLMIFLQEILSVIVTPLMLWFSLPSSAERIIDFVRDFTIHVDGIGYVCSFAVFDFSKNGNAKFGAVDKIPPKMTSNDGKMEKSFLNFKASHPDWVPDQSGSVFLQSLQKTMPQSGPKITEKVRGKRSTERLAPDSYAMQRLRARRGLDTSVNMTSTIFQPSHLRYPARITEEGPKDNLLGESYMDTKPVAGEAVEKKDKMSAGVLGLMHQFYQEAGHQKV